MIKLTISSYPHLTLIKNKPPQFMVPELLILNDFSEQPDIILPAMMKIFSVLTGNQHLPGFLRNNRTAAIRIAVQMGLELPDESAVGKPTKGIEILPDECVEKFKDVALSRKKIHITETVSKTINRDKKTGPNNIQSSGNKSCC